MKRSRLLTLLAGSAAVMITACATHTPTSDSAQRSRAGEEGSNEASSAADAGALQRYDGTAYRYPIRARYPASMAVDGGCMGEGCGFSFIYLPRGNALDDAKVHVFLPAGTGSAADLHGMVTGPDGLLDRAGWTINSSQQGGAGAFPYDWVETVIRFSAAPGQAGHVLLGETSGQAVQVVMTYPVDMAQAFRRDARIILESLEFEDALLPLASAAVR
jgi:hypothetical protein